jgi:hypothetical protein
MKKVCIIAALLMATTSAYAGNSISLEIDGHRIRIEAPKNCSQLSCLQISGFDFKGLQSNRFDGDEDVAVKSDSPAQNPTSAPTVQVTPQAPAGTATAPASTAVASTPPAPAIKDNVAPPAPPAASAAAPVQMPATPLGVWATEENKGNVRIEPCGESLCGYAVKTGEKILINMRPQDSKWVGHIHDPDSGRNYDSSIALKGANSLRVQGCAFGSMFCGGQTWNRVS